VLNDELRRIIPCTFFLHGYILVQEVFLSHIVWEVGKGKMGGTGSDIMGAMGAMGGRHNFYGRWIDIKLGGLM